MRFALAVCGVLLMLILAPIDGRLKYAEVMPADTLKSLLSRPRLPTGGGVEPGLPTDGQGGESVTRMDPAPTNEIAQEDKGGNPESEVVLEPGVGGMDGPHDRSSLSCFPPADLLHKYDWARYHLRHLAEKSKLQISPERRPDEELGENPRLLGDKSLRSSAKRSDHNRELSSDLYAQYPSSCACQTKYELLDLGYTHFPRYVVNAICQNRSANSRKCWRGSSCKEIPYKVRVLTRRSDNESSEQDHHSTLLPEPLREYWRFKTVTIAAACQCSI